MSMSAPPVTRVLNKDPERIAPSKKIKNKYKCCAPRAGAITNAVKDHYSFKIIIQFILINIHSPSSAFKNDEKKSSYFPLVYNTSKRKLNKT